MRSFLLLIGTLLSCSVYSQKIISGIIKDAHTGEILVGATLQASELGITSISDDSGRFDLRIPDLQKGNFLLEIRHIGYDVENIQVKSNEQGFLVIDLKSSTTVTEAVVVRATRAQEKIPMTFSSLEKPSIQKQNFGQDMPFVLQFTPSAVSTSDAGTGIGYTGLRIRGSDGTRVNVTINGIPYNDSESQSVYWVDIPDIASSSQSIQIQRGIGTSSNGAGAFGATINLQTNTLNNKPYAELIQSMGSFNTLRTTVGAGTGKMKNNLSFDLRVSKINNDGFIDRASSDLTSYYTSFGYYGGKTVIKAIQFGGLERTFQSWYGVPESRLNNDIEAMIETANTEGWNESQLNHLLNSNSRTFNFYTYKNQVDDYNQHHTQLHLSHRFNPNLTGNISLHYTKGKGYYEEFKEEQSVADYGIINFQPIPETDLVRRRWLDNHFYGTTWSLQWDKNKWNSIFGGGWNYYDGDHFGKVIGSTITQIFPELPYRYYFNNGKKSDFNTFWKSSYAISSQIFLFGDVQYRRIRYQGDGIENDQEQINFDNNYHFFNPKAGFTWEFKPTWQWYSSMAIASREPVRSDIIDDLGGDGPRPERLTNLEAGIRHRTSMLALQANFYYMHYKDQLVLTGKLNDVGSSLRVNVPVSYRAGIELEGNVKMSKKLQWQGNLTVSRNKIRKFEEVIYDYGENFDEFNLIRNTFQNTDISFSPNMIIGSQLSLRLYKPIELTLLTKYVGEQFLDNTSNRSRMIDSYLLNDLRITWSMKLHRFREVSLSLLAANLFDIAYESNGYTYGYQAGATSFRQNFLYPQAGRNYMAMLTLKI